LNIAINYDGIGDAAFGLLRMATRMTSTIIHTATAPFAVHNQARTRFTIINSS
jgi:hypothetical protein